MSYQPILQVAARNYARDIIQGEPKTATLRPANGQFAYVFNYPTRGRPRIGVVYAPGVLADVYFGSRSYKWLGVKIGNQYGWVSEQDFVIDVGPEAQPEALPEALPAQGPLQEPEPELEPEPLQEITPEPEPKPEPEPEPKAPVKTSKAKK